MFRKMTHQLVYILLKLLYSTYRLKFSGLENLEKAKQIHPNGSFIFALWHEHFLAGIFSIRGFSPCAMVSPSKDGDFVAHLVTKLGYSVARGSSSRGGRQARNDAVRALEAGQVAAITVDGPRGPRNKCKAGVIHLSQTTKTPILPISPITQNPKVFNKSWDKNKFPRPFSKIVLRFGEIVYVPEKPTAEEFNSFREKLDEGLISTEKVATKDLEDWKKLSKIHP